jgi:hypothetical protein
MAINKDFIIPDAGLQVNGAAVISSSLGVNGAATIANTLTVNGALTVANTLAVGNTTVTGNVNVSVAANVGGAIRAGGLITGAAGADITGTANASVAINIGANVNLSVSAVNVGNSTSNTVVTQTSVNTGNSTLFTTIGQATGLFGNSTVNTFITNSSIRTGNSSVYTNVTATALTTNGTLSVTGAATFSNNVTVSGDFTVSGTTTFVNTATLNVSDNIIALNTDVAGAPSENAGVEVNRGTSSNVSLIWNESTDRWQISSNTSTFGNIHSTLVDVVLGTDTSGAYVATITGGDGLTGSGTGEGSTPTLAVGAGNGITVAADSVAVDGANGISVTTDGVNVLAGSGLLSNVSGVHVVAGTDGGLVSNATGVFVTAGSGLVANATGVHVGTANGISVLADAVTAVGANGISVTTAGINVVAGTELTSNASGVHHNDITRTNTTTGNTSPNYAGTFTAVDSVTTNARGHVTGVNTKTVTMPSSNNTTYDMLAVANTTASNAILRLADSSNANDNVFFVGTDEVVTSSNATHIIIDHADVARSDGSSAASPASGGTFTAIDTVTTNARGHVTAVNLKTVTLPVDPNTTYDLLAVANTSASNAMLRLQNSSNANDTVYFVGTDEVVTSSNATHVIIDHADVARSDASSSASPASGGTFTAVDSVTTNARGHVTAINVKTVTLPIDPDTNTTYDLATVANTVANEGLVNLVGSNSTTDTAKIIGLDEIAVSSNATAVYVDHSDVARSDGTSSASPASGGTFTAVDSVTTNARGHVTGLNLKTVTLPVDPNTTYTGANGVILAGTVFSANVGATLVANATGIHMPAVATAGTSTGGLSAITIDAQGRVTSVTGSAGYLTSAVTSVTGTAGRVTSSGGTTPAIDLATAGAGAASYSTGISAITVDAYGRVTSVTGSAGYVTSSGVTSVSGTTGRITSSGGATPTIDLDTAGTAGSRTGGISAITTDAYGRVTSVTGSAGYVTSSGVTSVTGTAPVVSSGGATPAISMAAATASVDGYMTSTFAAKLNGIAAGATNVTNTNQLTNGAGFITAVPNASTQVSSLGVGTAASGTGGEIRATNEITAYYSSDRDLKTNITPIENALGKIRSLSGVMFDWTDEYIASRGGEDGYFVRKHDTGVIAQDVQAVLPEVVATREDGTLAVKYEKMMGLVIQSINELADLVDEMKKGS